MPHGLLVGMIDWPRRRKDWLDAASSAAPWMDALILRAKAEPAAVILEAADALASHLPSTCGFVVADRADVARITRAHGVHLPGRGIPAQRVRDWWPKAWISQSIHDFADLPSLAGADYAVLGNLFSTRSKPGKAALSANSAEQLIRAGGIPVLGIGGVTLERLPQLRGSGLAGVVVVDGIWDAPDPAATAQAMRQALAVWPAAEQGVKHGTHD